MIIGVENSSWNNIGDGFYQFSLLRLLEKEFPNHTSHMHDAPPRRSFKIPRNKRSTAFDARSVARSDMLILSGPILGAHFLDDYAQVIQQQLERGGQYMMVSVHGEASGAEPLKSFLEEHPPELFATRDTQTHEFFGSKKYRSYDGVCTASLVSITCDEDTFVTDSDTEYITVSFYDGHEPAFSVRRTDDGDIAEVSGISAWDKTPSWRLKRHLEWSRKYPTKVDGFDIVRPVHDISYPFHHLRYARDNSLLSYNPLIYLSLYRGTSLTISNRLHAVLPTISFGKPAAYVGRTPRNGALERLGIRDHQGTLLALSPDVVKEEYSNLVEVLRDAGL